MLNFSFPLHWPWFKDRDDLCKDYFYKSWRVTEHKTLEFQVSRGGNAIVGSSFRWDMNCSHAGVMFDITLFRRFLHVSLTDNRHWNYEKNRYVDYSNPEEAEEYW